MRLNAERGKRTERQVLLAAFILLMVGAAFILTLHSSNSITGAAVGLGIEKIINNSFDSRENRSYQENNSSDNQVSNGQQAELVVPNGSPLLDAPPISMIEEAYPEIAAEPFSIAGGLENATGNATSSSCGNITRNITLTTDLFSNGTCFNFGAARLILDCSGYRVTYALNGTAIQYGISDQGGFDNITIKNCIIVEGNASGSNSDAINLLNVLRPIIVNNTIQVNSSLSDAFVSLGGNSQLSKIQNNTLILAGSSQIGLHIGSDTDNALVEGNIITGIGSATTGMFLSQADSLNITRNIFNITSTGSSTAINLSLSGPNTLTENEFVRTNGTSPLLFIGSNSGSNAFVNNNITVETSGQAIGDKNTYPSTISQLNRIIYNNSFGEINLSLYNIAVNGSIIRNQTFFIQDNLVGLTDDPNASNWDASARIKLNGFTYGQAAYLLKDGIRCDLGDSCNISYDIANGIVYANVSSFSNYTTTLGSICGTMNKSILLGINANSSATCFTVTRSNITLDCAGFGVYYGQDASGYGINNSGFDNITVKNCLFRKNSTAGNQNYGAYFVNSENNTFTNTSFFTNGTDNNYGVYFIGVKKTIINKTIIVTNAQGGSNYGIYLLSGSSNNNISNITISTNGTTHNHGVHIESASNNNRITEVTITTQGTGAGHYGVVLNTSNGTLLLMDNITANGTGSPNYGFFMQESAYTVFFNITATSLTRDFSVYDSSSTGPSSIIYNTSFGLINRTSTNLTANVSLLLGENIFIESNLVGVTDNPQALQLNGTARIILRNIHSQPTPQLLKGGVRCDNTNACNISYDSTTRELFANISSFSNYTSLATTACSAISAGMTLTKGENVSGDCFIVTSNNIIINGANLTVTGNKTGIGINISNLRNITVLNLTIRNFSTGIFLANSSEINLTLLQVNNNSAGIHLLESNNNTIFTNRIFNNSQNGTILEDSMGNILFNNYFANNTNHSFDNGTNSWNRSYECFQGTIYNILDRPCFGGNYWEDYTGGYGTYNGTGNISYSIRGGAQDNYPIGSSTLLQCNITLTTNDSLVPGSVFMTGSYCLTFGEKVSVDGKGLVINGVDISSGYGLNISSNNSLVKNFILKNGAYVYANHKTNKLIKNIRVENITVRDGAYGLYLLTSNSTYSNITLANLSRMAIYLQGFTTIFGIGNNFTDILMDNVSYTSEAEQGAIHLEYFFNNTFVNWRVYNTSIDHIHTDTCTSNCYNYFVNSSFNSSQVTSTSNDHYYVQQIVIVNVSNGSGEPLPDVAVRGYDVLGAEEAARTTDAQGIAQLYLTEYYVSDSTKYYVTANSSIIARKGNYTRGDVSFNLVDSSTSHLNITLQKRDPCGTVSDPRFEMDGNHSCPTQGLVIGNDSVSIFGNKGYLIGAGGSDGISVSGKSKAYVDNLNITSFDTGINISSSNHGMFINLTITNVSKGIVFQNSNNNTIKNSIIRNVSRFVASTTNEGGTLNCFVNSTIDLENTTVSGTAQLCKKWYVTVNVTISGAALPAANVYAYDSTGLLESSGQTDTTGLLQLELTEILKNATGSFYKTPHNITINFTSTLSGSGNNSTTINLTLTNNTKVNLSLGLNCTGVYDDIAITTNTTLCPGVVTVTDAGYLGIIRMTTDNLKLSCDNTTIISPTESMAGIYAYGRNNISIQGCNFQASTGLAFYYTTNSVVNGSTFVDTSQTTRIVYFYQSSNNTLSFSTISGGSPSGVYGGLHLYQGQKNIFYNNTFKDSKYGVYLGYTGNNTFYHNSFSSPYSEVAGSDALNFFNSSSNRTGTSKIVGNYYASLCDSTPALSDADNDGYYDSGTDYPLNLAGGHAKLSAYGYDHAPLVVSCGGSVFLGSSSSSSSSSSAGGAGAASSAAATTAPESVAEAAPYTTAAQVAAALSASSSGGSLSITNTGKNTAIVQVSFDLDIENKEAILAQLEKLGYTGEKLRLKLAAISTDSQSPLGKSYSFLGIIGGKGVPLGYQILPGQVEGGLLGQIFDDRQLTIPPGETITLDVAIESGLGIGSRTVAVSFQAFGETVLEKEVVIESNVVTGIAADQRPEDKLIDLYIFIGEDEEGSATPPSAPASEALGENTLSALTGAAVSAIKPQPTYEFEYSINKEVDTEFGDIATFSSSSNSTLFVQQLRYSGIPAGDRTIHTMLRKNGVLVAENSFPVTISGSSVFAETAALVGAAIGSLRAMPWVLVLLGVILLLLPALFLFLPRTAKASSQRPTTQPMITPPKPAYQESPFIQQQVPNIQERLYRQEIGKITEQIQKIPSRAPPPKAPQVIPPEWRLSPKEQKAPFIPNARRSIIISSVPDTPGHSAISPREQDRWTRELHRIDTVLQDKRVKEVLPQKRGKGRLIAYDQELSYIEKELKRLK